MMAEHEREDDVAARERDEKVPIPDDMPKARRALNATEQTRPTRNDW